MSEVKVVKYNAPPTFSNRDILNLFVTKSKTINSTTKSAEIMISTNLKANAKAKY